MYEAINLEKILSHFCKDFLFLIKMCFDYQFVIIILLDYLNFVYLKMHVILDKQIKNSNCLFSFILLLLLLLFFISEQIAVRQAQVDKLYAGLKDLAQERRGKLEEVLKLYMLSREIEDLLQWIAEREVVAKSQELGQEYEHVTVSINAFFLLFYL